MLHLPRKWKKHQSCPNVHHVKVCDHSTVILPGCRSRSRSKISMFCTDSSSQKGQCWCRLGNDFPMIYSVVNDLITRYSLTNLFVEILIQTMSHFSVFELDNSAYRLYSHPQQVQWRLSHCLISGSQFYSVAVIAVVEHLVFGGLIYTTHYHIRSLLLHIQIEDVCTSLTAMLSKWPKFCWLAAKLYLYFVISCDVNDVFIKEETFA